MAGASAKLDLGAQLQRQLADLESHVAKTEEKLKLKAEKIQENPSLHRKAASEDSQGQEELQKQMAELKAQVDEMERKLKQKEETLKKVTQANQKMKTLQGEISADKKEALASRVASASDAMMMLAREEEKLKALEEEEARDARIYADKEQKLKILNKDIERNRKELANLPLRTVQPGASFIETLANIEATGAADNAKAGKEEQELIQSYDNILHPQEAQETVEQSQKRLAAELKVKELLSESTEREELAFTQSLQASQSTDAVQKSLVDQWNAKKSLQEAQEKYNKEMQAQAMKSLGVSTKVGVASEQVKPMPVVGKLNLPKSLRLLAGASTVMAKSMKDMSKQKSSPLVDPDYFIKGEGNPWATVGKKLAQSLHGR